MEVIDDPGELRAQRQIIPFFSQCKRLWESTNTRLIFIRIEECGGVLCLVGEDGD